MLGFPVLDSVASVVICLFILKVAFGILKTAITNMLDTSCGEAYDKKLKAFVAEQDEVACVDVLHSRSFGSKVYVDLEIEIDGSKPLHEAHAISERITQQCGNQFSRDQTHYDHMNPMS